MKPTFLYQDSRGNCFDSLESARRILRNELSSDPVAVQPFPLRRGKYICRTCVKNFIHKTITTCIYYGL